MLISVACVLAMVTIGIIFYARRKGNRLRNEIRELDRGRLDEIFEDVLKRLKPSYPQLDPNNYSDTLTLLEKELRSNPDKFIGLLQRGDYYEFWIVNLGVFVGEFIRRHTAAPADWVQDATGRWQIRFKLQTRDHFWDPFTEAHRQYLKSGSDLLLGMPLLKNLK
jgi:hypothetical protein